MARMYKTAPTPTDADAAAIPPTLLSPHAAAFWSAVLRAVEVLRGMLGLIWSWWWLDVRSIYKARISDEELDRLQRARRPAAI